MNLPVDVSIDDYSLVMKTKDSLTLGHYFAFADAAAESRQGRRARLLAEPAKSLRVIPLLGESFSVAGMTLTPRERVLDPLGAVVVDRDLYRAELDHVYLFIAMPKAPKGLELVVECNGEAFTVRTPDLKDGVSLEILSMLLPGSYRAQLSVDGRKIGTPADFTVAEYTLAPLAARLVSHELDRSNDEVRFELSVESYQVPFDGKLDVSLVDDRLELSSTRLKAELPGRYVGRLSMSGEGPFRLQLVSTEDPGRIAQVAIPGSRARERELTVVGELGQEQLFSMMPEPGALPLRGGFLSAGDFLATPVVVEHVVGDRCVIHANKDLDSLKLVVLDLMSGGMRVVDHGDANSGDDIVVDSASSLCTIFAGCVVEDRPFEGYTSFFRPSRLAIDLRVPETIRPREELRVRLSCGGVSGSVPVLLAVRDQRLTAAARPSAGLGASLKKNITDATAGMEQGFFESDAFLPSLMLAGAGPRAMGAVRSRRFSARIPDMATPGFAEGMSGLWARLDASSAGDSVETVPPPRSDFAEVLFFDLVTVSGQTEVVIPVSDALGSFAVEAFAVVGGDWTEARGTVVVDQPVRIDLDFPPAVHEGDKVTGRLRASTSSGRGKVHVTRDGKPVPTAAGEIQTPVELELDVVPGAYVAHVEDVATGETDSMELVVGRPGVLKSVVKELGLLLEGDHINLDSADALTLRVLPAVDESFESLVTATAGYAHLCCEQTAAKILAATFMWLTSKGEGQRREAEQIILGGIEREKKMLRPGHGFAMYPEDGGVVDHYSRAAVRYLWSLDRLDAVPGISPHLRRAAKQGLDLADKAAAGHDMQRVPEIILSAADAYAAAAAGKHSAADRYFGDILDFSGDEVSVKGGSGRVDGRAVLAYSSASFIAMGQFEKGARLANQVTRQLNDQGRLYSTLDSVAAIVLMIELRTSRLISGQGRLRVNGKEVTVLEATSLSDQVESIEVLDGVAAVEITRIHEDDWTRFETGFPLRVGFRDAKNKKKDRFHRGERVELVVTLRDGYRAGDLAHVSLPACLSWIRGGGKVKRLTIDFEGRDELRIPLIVTSKIEAEQHFALCVRNMFEEERVTNPGLLSVKAPRFGG